MLQIVFMILKIIGIVLLVTLAAVLLLLFSVLCIPIRYKIQGSYHEKLKGVLKLSWFLHFISLKAFYEGDYNIIVRILGIPIYDARKKEEKQLNAPHRRKTRDTKKAESKVEEKDTLREEKIQMDKHLESEPLKPELDETCFEEAFSDETFEKKSSNEDTLKKEKKNIFYEFIRKIKDFFHNIEYTIKRIYDKIKQLYTNLQYYYDLIQREETKAAFQLCRKQLYKTWKNIRPKKLQLYLHVGNEDPCVTGEIMAFYGIIYPFVGKQIQIVPEFQESVLEADLKTHGHITVFVLIKVFIRIYFDKNIRNLLQLLKKEDSHGR